jgi:hypothetical protein
VIRGHDHPARFGQAIPSPHIPTGEDPEGTAGEKPGGTIIRAHENS